MFFATKVNLKFLLLFLQSINLLFWLKQHAFYTEILPGASNAPKMIIFAHML